VGHERGDAAALPRPFYTTKGEKKRGTGLALRWSTACRASTAHSSKSKASCVTARRCFSCSTRPPLRTRALRAQPAAVVDIRRQRILHRGRRSHIIESLAPHPGRRRPHRGGCQRGQMGLDAFAAALGNGAHSASSSQTWAHAVHGRSPGWRPASRPFPSNAVLLLTGVGPAAAGGQRRARARRPRPQQAAEIRELRNALAELSIAASVDNEIMTTPSPARWPAAHRR